MAQELDSYKCETCDMTFDSQDELQEHQRTVHQPGSGSAQKRGSEQFAQRNPGYEKSSYGRDTGAERKGPGSERQEEAPAPPKRAAR